VASSSDGPAGASLLPSPDTPPALIDAIAAIEAEFALVMGRPERVAAACESLGEQGRVKVNTRVITDFHLVEGGHGDGKMAVVEIRDNGCGIKEEELEKIFTPFFTTKQKGSGLGMAISLKIIEEHGGLLRIDSAPGEGTTVAVLLPLAGKHKRR